MHQVFLAVIRRFLKANFKKSIVLSYDKGSAFRDGSASFLMLCTCQINWKLRRFHMSVIIKRMETDEEIRGKAFVHWKAWHEAYSGLVSQEYLDSLTYEKCENMAFSWRNDLFVAMDGDTVIGFIGYGSRGKEAPNAGEIFALYVLSEYYGTGIGLRLMQAGLKELSVYPEVHLWVLKGNKRAIRFYKKCGFVPTGEELVSPKINAAEIKMKLTW